MFLTNRNLLTKKQSLFDWRSKFTSIPGQLIPLDFDGLHTWLRADFGIVLDGNNRVISWTDLVNGNVFSQATSTVRPTYIESDSVNNNYPSLSFSGSVTEGGTNDRLFSTLPASNWNFLHDGSGMTAIIVMQDLNGASNRMVLSTSASGGPAVTGFQFYTGTNSTPATYIASYVRDLAVTNHASAQAVTTLNTNTILVSSHGIDRSPQCIFRRGGTTITSTAYVSVPNPGTANDATNSLTIGAGNNNGQAADKIIVPEILIYNRSMTLSEIQLLEGYLNNRYTNLL